MNENFQSFLAPEIKQFIAYKRALGYSYRRAAFTLKNFDRHVGAHAKSNRYKQLPDLLSSWLSRCSARKSVSVAMELGTLRQFFKYRRRFHPHGFLPGREWAPRPVKSDFVPHIFSPPQIRTLLDESKELRYFHRACPAIRVLILILYCTGLRFGEALRLQIGDVDLRRRLFFIRESKGRTRWVPFRADLERELRNYRALRDLMASVASQAPFLVRPDGKEFSAKRASDVIRRLLRRLQLKPARGRTGPRPYDLRHTFAVHRLISWHRKGVDVNARLPWLSAYLGHDNIMGTEVYLQATSELMHLASQRLRERLYHREPYER